MVTKKDVLNIAKLSKLLVKESELESLAKDMANIIDFADEINKATTPQDEFDNINGISNALRDDAVCESFDRDSILKNSGGGKNGFFYVKNHK